MLAAWYERPRTLLLCAKCSGDSLHQAWRVLLVRGRSDDGACEHYCVAPRAERGARRRRVRAAVGHALAFETWRSLVSHQGLSRSETIELMEAVVHAAGRD